MTTTTIRIPDDLKLRVAAAAEAAGLTAHGFILRAIETQTAEAEEQAEFERLAEERWQDFQRTRLAIPFDEAARYLRDRAAGNDVPRPQARRIELAVPPAPRARRPR